MLVTSKVLTSINIAFTKQKLNELSENKKHIYFNTNDVYIISIKCVFT